MVASSIALLLASYVIVGFFAPCPYFASDPTSASSMPCCPRQTDDFAKHCPLSETVETCPFYITESKIGIAAAFAVPVTALPVSTDPQVISTGLVIEVATQAPGNGIDIYLRNRVLLI
jgi:hypothetical protein